MYCVAGVSLAEVRAVILAPMKLNWTLTRESPGSKPKILGAIKVLVEATGVPDKVVEAELAVLDEL